MKLTTTELNEKELKQLSGCRFLVGEFDNILSFDIKKNRFFLCLMNMAVYALLYD